MRVYTRLSERSELSRCGCNRSESDELPPRGARKVRSDSRGLWALFLSHSFTTHGAFSKILTKTKNPLKGEEMGEKVRVIVEKVTDTSVRIYHVRHRISNRNFETFCFPLEAGDADSMAVIGPIASSIVNHLNTVDGVDEILIKPYEFLIIKGLAYDWKDIEADIFYALEMSVGSLDVKNANQQV